MTSVSWSRVRPGNSQQPSQPRKRSSSPKVPEDPAADKAPGTESLTEGDSLPNENSQDDYWNQEATQKMKSKFDTEILP